MSSIGRWSSRTSSSSSGGSSHLGSLMAPGKFKIDDSLALLGDKVLQHLNMALMQKPLEFGIFKHDYILLQYAGGNLWIKAEKGGESAHGVHDAGIALFPVHDFGVPENLKAIDGSSIRFQTNNIRLGKGKDRWSLAQMFDLLSSVDPNYNVLAGNCWKYAHDCAESVLNWCIENAEAEDVREALKAKLAELKEVERPAPRGVIGSVVHPSAPESKEARKLIEQRLKRTVDKLPDGSIRRKGAQVFLRVFDHKSKSEQVRGGAS